MTGAAAAGLLETFPTQVAGMSLSELAVARKACTVWAEKRPRNVLRTRYFDGRVRVRLLTDTLPVRIVERLRPVLDWPAKACTALARRSVFEGFTTVEGDVPGALVEAWEDNRMDLEFPQAVLSAYKHGCSFVTVTRGANGPVIQARSAEWTAGLWNRDSRSVSALLAIRDADQYGAPTAWQLYLPGFVIDANRRARGRWEATRYPTGLDEVAAEPIVYDPQLDKPFGRSRISRAVMSTTQDALRQLARMEIAAEHYAIPRVIVLGLAQDAFREGKWKLAWDQIAGLTRDENDQLPTVQQLQQLTMQPLIDQLRQYASKFSSETGLPLSSLGIVQDNPPSAEAMYAAKADLIEEAIIANVAHGGALKRVARKVLHLTGAAPTRLGVKWANPAFGAFGATGDALVKLATVFPWLGETVVGLEAAGFSQGQIERLLAERRRGTAGARLDALVNAANDAVA